MSSSRFVILAAPRTGSNLLCTLLNGHPDILCHHEVFNPEGIFVALDRRESLDLGSPGARDADPFAFLEHVWGSGERQLLVGFKMTSGQAPAVVSHLLQAREVKKIVLRRKNRVKTYVSTLIAAKTGQWEVYSRADLVRERPRVRVDPAELRQHAEINQAFYDTIRRSLGGSGQTFLEMEYEDLLSVQEHQRVLAFLGVRPAALEAASIKQNSEDLRHLILDFSRLDEQLRGTSFSDELHDGSD